MRQKKAGGRLFNAIPCMNSNSLSLSLSLSLSYYRRNFIIYPKNQFSWDRSALWAALWAAYFLKKPDLLLRGLAAFINKTKKRQNHYVVMKFDKSNRFGHSFCGGNKKRSYLMKKKAKNAGNNGKDAVGANPALKLTGALILITLIGLSTAGCGGGSGNGGESGGCAHDFSQWHETAEPTCTTAGEETEKCSKCGELGTIKQAGAPAHGHFFNNRKCAELCFDFGMALAEKGTFTMGPDIWNDNATVEATFTKDFYISKYLVTQELYEEIMGANPSYFLTDAEDGEKQGRRPVERVTWYDALDFCNKLSEAEGLEPVYTLTSITTAESNGITRITGATVAEDFTTNGYRLPTDAQWEYAAKAGTSTKWHFGDDESKLEEYAWYGWDDTYTIPANANGMTHEVGLLKPNAWGLYDTHGNVWEWCWDWWGNYPDEPVADYTGAASGDYRVERGGSWGFSAEYSQPVSRFSGVPGGGFYNLGFRLVCP